MPKVHQATFTSCDPLNAGYPTWQVTVWVCVAVHFTPSVCEWIMCNIILVQEGFTTLETDNINPQWCGFGTHTFFLRSWSCKKKKHFTTRCQRSAPACLSKQTAIVSAANFHQVIKDISGPCTSDPALPSIVSIVGQICIQFAGAVRPT